MADEISRTGKWVDSASGRVVESEPAEGRLLVSPGGPITPDVREVIRQAEVAQPPAVDESAPDEPDTSEGESEPAEKDATSPARKRAASK